MKRRILRGDWALVRDDDGYWYWQSKLDDRQSPIFCNRRLAKQWVAPVRVTHVGHPLYGTWKSMRARCLNPDNKAFHYYGGRGISISTEWSDFLIFAADMGPRLSSKHSIDRIDNDKGYSKENCRWATKSEQAYNRRRKSS